MINSILRILAVLFAPDLSADGEALRRTVSNQAGESVHGADARPFSLEEAVEHVVHARIAAAITGVDADDLLAIAWHESRYDPAVSTNEGPGMWYADDGAGPGAYSSTRWTCGVMTPNPIPRQCTANELEIGYGYLAGARHLAVWQRQCGGDRLCALNGYAGGADDGQVRGYKTWEVFAWRAAWIKSERRRAPQGA